MFLECSLCADDCLDYPIHSLFHSNIEKDVYFLIHEVLLIYNVFRYQAECNRVLLILIHWVVELEVIDIK